MEIVFSNSEVFLKQKLPRHLHVLMYCIPLNLFFLLGFKVLNLKCTFIKSAEMSVMSIACYQASDILSLSLSYAIG